MWLYLCMWWASRIESIAHKGEVLASCVGFGSMFTDRQRIMYVLAWRTVHALTRGLFWCLFPELRSNEGNKHQNNTRAELSDWFKFNIIVYHSVYFIWHFLQGTTFVRGSDFSILLLLLLLINDVLPVSELLCGLLCGLCYILDRNFFICVMEE